MEKSKRLSPDDILENLLNDDEQVLWLGQPNRYRVFTIDDFFLIPFSLFWGGGTLIWTLGVFFMGAYPMLCVGIPFVVAGQFIIWGRFVYRYIKRCQTYYVITDSRVIVFSTFLGKDIRSIYLESLADLNIRFSTIYFNHASRPKGFASSSQVHWNQNPLDALHSIPNADEVYKLLQAQIHYLRH